MSKPWEVIAELESDNSRLAKESVIARESELDNVEFFRGARAALDSMITFGIKKVEEKKNDQKDYKENQVKEESDLPDKPMKEIGKINKQVDHPIEGEKVKYVYPKQDKKEKAHLVKGGKGKQLNLPAHKIKSK